MNTSSLEKEKEELINKIVMPPSRFDFYYPGVSSMGTGTEHNSPLIIDQLMFALVLTQRPIVLEILDNDSIDWQTYKVDHLVEAKVLSGYKILDMGCGYLPTFARAARYLGANVYTVDVETTDSFKNRKRMKPDQLKLEDENHIVLDLNSENALEILLKRTNGEFDLVTSAHLETWGRYGPNNDVSPPNNAKNIAMALLKQEGIYYKSDGKNSVPEIK